MTRREANIHFPHNEGDDLDELWEERFFKHKEYFLTRPAVHKTWYSRLRKISKQYNAYLIIANKEIVDMDFSLETDTPPTYSDNFFEAYNQYHQFKNNHKMELYKTEEFIDLFKAASKWLSTEFYHALHWKHPESENNEIKALLSQEVDPVAFITDLQKTES